MEDGSFGGTMGGRERKLVYRGDRLRAVAFPLGGIGTGTIAICGDGGLRQWQIFNNINHLAHVPHSFFAVWVRSENTAPVARILQSNIRYDDVFEPAPSVNDHIVPRGSRLLLDTFPGVDDIMFIGEYPSARLTYFSSHLPVRVMLRAYSPFAPLDPDDSGLPAIVFHFDIENPTDETVDVSLLMSQQNAVGWDDAEEIDGINHPHYGGNINRLVTSRGLVMVELTNTTLPGDHPRQGQMALAALSDSASVRTQWIDPELLWADFSADGKVEPPFDERPSPPGQTVNAALACPLNLKPGSSGRITFLLTWRFPNRYVDWEQPALEQQERYPHRGRLWLGNYYSSRFGSAVEVAEYIRDNIGRFDEIADRFEEAMHDTSLPDALIEAVSSQISVVRAPTCLRVEDGGFYGFEGCHGASTEYLGSRGGCCPLNCTHVWNYAMTVARLFPQLERSMRETEWLRQQHPTGYLPHRVIVPLSLERPWDKWIGGPPFPAVDGLLGAVLRTYREFRISGEREWLATLWERVRLALEHVISRYDRGDGVIHGPQPCTYDVEIEGPNSFIESLYLASLRAGEEMAKIMGDRQSARRYRERFRVGKKTADALLWDAEYYVHRYDPATESAQAYGLGCHSDQLFGQWWAHCLGLGYILPKNHVRRALRSVWKYNRRSDFTAHQQFPRKYLRDDEAGMLNCAWPKGARPETPLLYSDEVWTGIEYEVAGAQIFEGLIKESLSIVENVRKRHDGRIRSPWNEVECGDHYVRAMSSWALLDAASGFLNDAAKGLLEFNPRITPERFKSFFITSTGWGSYSQTMQGVTMIARLSVRWGRVPLRELGLRHADAERVTARIDSKEIPLTWMSRKKKISVRFSETLMLEKNQTLTVTVN